MLTFCVQWSLASSSFVFLGAVLMLPTRDQKQVTCCVLPQSPS